MCMSLSCQKCKFSQDVYKKIMKFFKFLTISIANNLWSFSSHSIFCWTQHCIFLEFDILYYSNNIQIHNIHFIRAQSYGYDITKLTTTPKFTVLCRQKIIMTPYNPGYAPRTLNLPILTQHWCASPSMLLIVVGVWIRMLAKWIEMIHSLAKCGTPILELFGDSVVLPPPQLGCGISGVEGLDRCINR